MNVFTIKFLDTHLCYYLQLIVKGLSVMMESVHRQNLMSVMDTKTVMMGVMKMDVVSVHVCVRKSRYMYMAVYT